MHRTANICSLPPSKHLIFHDLKSSLPPVGGGAARGCSLKKTPWRLISSFFHFVNFEKTGLVKNIYRTTKTIMAYGGQIKNYLFSALDNRENTLFIDK